MDFLYCLLHIILKMINFIKAKNLLIDQLNEQILDDDAHFELSPMYHQIIFSRLLDSINLINLNKNGKMMNLHIFKRKI